MNKFVARYYENGFKKSIVFDKTRFTEETAKAYLENKGIQNFFFLFEPLEPYTISENEVMYSGEVGFDITLNNLIPNLTPDKKIKVDTFGGDLWEGLRIYDYIKSLDFEPYIEVLGSCFSSGMQILTATDNGYISENSRGLIHAPWSVIAGNDTELRKEAIELEREKINLANIYAKKSGKTTEEILNLMQEERILSAKEMIDLNFAKPLNKTNININADTNNATNTNINDNKMNEQEKKELTKLQNMFNSIKNIFNPIKNIILQDVNGIEIDFGSDIETVEQITVGTTATVDGKPATGEYVMPDGTTYVFENGAVIEIRQPETVTPEETLQSENETLQAENEQLQNKISEKEKEIENLKKDKAKIEAKFNEIEKSFNDFKNKFSDEKAKDVLTPEIKEDKKKKRVTFNFNK